jgi:hypothetical protein
VNERGWFWPSAPWTRFVAQPSAAVWIFSLSGFDRVVRTKPVRSETDKQNGCQVKQESIPEGVVLHNCSEGQWTNGVQVDRMEDMKKLIVQTRNSLYEIIVIDGPRGEILVRGGKFFPELTPALLGGATYSWRYSVGLAPQ